MTISKMPLLTDLAVQNGYLALHNFELALHQLTELIVYDERISDEIVSLIQKQNKLVTHEALDVALERIMKGMRYITQEFNEELQRRMVNVTTKN